jgi:hypothetical protein
MFIGPSSALMFQGNKESKKTTMRGLKRLLQREKKDSKDRLEISSSSPKPSSTQNKPLQTSTPTQKSSPKVSKPPSETSHKSQETICRHSAQVSVEPILSENARGKLPETVKAPASPPNEVVYNTAQERQHLQNRAKKELQRARQFFNTLEQTEELKELVKAMEENNTTPHNVLKTLPLDKQEELMAVLRPYRDPDWITYNLNARMSSYTHLSSVQDQNFLNSLPEYIRHGQRPAKSFINPEAWAENRKVAVNDNGKIMFP